MDRLKNACLRFRLAWWMAYNTLRYPLSVLLLVEYQSLVNRGAVNWTVSIGWDTGDTSSAAGYRSLASALRQLNEDYHASA